MSVWCIVITTRTLRRLRGAARNSRGRARVEEERSVVVGDGQKGRIASLPAVALHFHHSAEGALAVAARRDGGAVRIRCGSARETAVTVAVLAGHGCCWGRCGQRQRRPHQQLQRAAAAAAAAIVITVVVAGGAGRAPYHCSRGRSVERGARCFLRCGED